MVLVNLWYFKFPLIFITKTNLGDNTRTKQETSVMQLHSLIILYIVSRTLQVSVKRMCLHRVLVNFRYVIFPLIIITKVNFGDNKRTTQETSVMRLQLYISSLSHIIYHFWHITMMNLFNTWFYLSVLIFGRSQLPRQNKVFISTFKYGLYSLKEKKWAKLFLNILHVVMQNFNWQKNLLTAVINL